MKPVKILAVLIALSSAKALAEDAIPSANNPYASVVSRNLFGLVPIPVASPVDNSQPKDPPPKITPNGIMKLFGHLQVLFKVSIPPKPGQPPHEQSYIMREGERQDEITVTKIDEKSDMITFNNHGVIQELPLSSAPNISTPSAAPGGIHPPPGSPMARPGLPPALQRRLGQSQNGYRPGPASYSPRAMANMSNNSDSRIYNPSAATSQQQLSPEQQALIIEAERQKYQAEGSPIANILPPTPLTQQLQNGGK